MTTADESTASTTVDQAGAPPAPADAPPPVTLVEVVPGLLVKFTRTSQLAGDQEVVGIVVNVDGARAQVADLGPLLDVPTNALRSVNG